ncbi:MAG: ABC transporter ATP-binding protein [Clostridiales bacterium]
MKKELLKVKDLSVSFDTYVGEIQAVRGVSFTIEEGKTLALVGESGCGKSVTAQTIMKLNPMPPARIKSGEIILDNIDIIRYKEKEMVKIRGSLVSMIFQDPMTCLNPTMTLGSQIAETLKAHNNKGVNIKEKVIEMLEMVKISNAKERYKEYPHQFSGGMRQRVMIAMALACSPKLLIADEPTTALDVTIQAQIMDILSELQKNLKTSIILITHDFGIVADIADHVAIMYAGKIVEKGSCDQIFYNPKHPYTRSLLKSIPRLDMDRKSSLYSIKGTPPDLFSPPVGCPFAARCEHCMKICLDKYPKEFIVNDGHYSACWLMHKDCVKRYGGDK